MSKRLYIVEFDDSGLHSLSVADPMKKLENGNLEIVKMLIGTYADEIYEHLTACSGGKVVPDVKDGWRYDE